MDRDDSFTFIRSHEGGGGVAGVRLPHLPRNRINLEDVTFGECQLVASNHRILRECGGDRDHGERAQGGAEQDALEVRFGLHVFWVFLMRYLV